MFKEPELHGAFSSSYVENIEKQFESTQHQNLQRLRENENLYSRESESLRNEIQSLKNRLGKNSED